jgi:hypothetical protein
MKTSSKLSIAAAAMAGLLAGASSRASASTLNVPVAPAQSITASSGSTSTAFDARLGTQAPSTLADTAKHDCKGMNACKGEGGCKTGDNGCKGKNSCKGKGGCKTNAMPSKLLAANNLGSHVTLADVEKHDCKGMNACKGQGGCKTGDNGCKGKNSCKGKGGCSTK